MNGQTDGNLNTPRPWLTHENPNQINHDSISEGNARGENTHYLEQICVLDIDASSGPAHPQRPVTSQTSHTHNNNVIVSKHVYRLFYRLMNESRIRSVWSPGLSKPGSSDPGLIGRRFVDPGSEGGTSPAGESVKRTMRTIPIVIGDGRQTVQEVLTVSNMQAPPSS